MRKRDCVTRQSIYIKVHKTWTLEFHVLSFHFPVFVQYPDLL